MSTTYMNANNDLDWVQAPPQASKYDRKSRRKTSNQYDSSSSGTKTYSNGTEEYYTKKASKKSSHYGKTQSKYAKKKKPSQYHKNGQYKNCSNYSKNRDYKGYSQFDELSTDVSDNTSPDRSVHKTCLNMKVEVLGEVVINKINPKFRSKRRKNNRFAAACELKAPEPTEIAAPMFL